jgi:hypothetical protein
MVAEEEHKSVEPERWCSGGYYGQCGKGTGVTISLVWEWVSHWHLHVLAFGGF